MLSYLKRLQFYIRDYWYRGRLNFEYLPDHVCIKILRNLELKEVVRLARVNRRLQEVSDITISQITTLDLADPMFKNVTEESMMRIFSLCASGLERLIFYENRLVALMKFRCPRLVALNFRKTRIENAVLRDVLINCPNLRELVYDTPVNTIFPVQSEKMESVDVRCCKVGFMYTLAQRCPNLKSLVIVADNYEAEAPSNEQIIDEMLDNVPNLETLTLEVNRSIVSYECAVMTSLQNLRSLRSLNLKWRGITDQSLHTISVWLPQLERLCIWDCTVCPTVTSHGIGALSALKNLREFSFKRPQWPHRPALYSGMQQLARRGCLQRAYLDGEILTAAATITFVLCCPELRLLRIRDIQKPPFPCLSLEDALAMVEAFKNFQQQDLAIVLESPWFILGIEEVKAAWIESTHWPMVARSRSTGSLQLAVVAKTVATAATAVEAKNVQRRAICCAVITDWR